LKWTPAGGSATVTVNGTNYTNGTTGVAIKTTDTVTVKWTGTEPTFTLTFPQSIVAGSLKGDLYAPTVYNHQDLLIATADFVEITSTLQPGSASASDDITFTNCYKCAEITLNALKNTTGMAMETGQFEFRLFEFEPGGQLKSTPVKTAQNEEPTNNGNTGEVHFGTFVYAEAGEYRYFLKETGEHIGWQMDPVCYLITVTVTENPDGSLSVAAAYTEADENGSPIDSDTGNWSTYNAGSPQAWPCFNNSFGGPIFPETGGTGSPVSVIGGLVLMSLCAAAFVIFKRISALAALR